jgi:hypothetical protein
MHFNFREYVLNYIFFRNSKRVFFGTISIVLCNPIFLNIKYLRLIYHYLHLSFPCTTLSKFSYACKSFSFNFYVIINPKPYYDGCEEVIFICFTCMNVCVSWSILRKFLFKEKIKNIFHFLLYLFYFPLTNFFKSPTFYKSRIEE